MVQIVVQEFQLNASFIFWKFVFFSPGQDPKSLKNVSGFSLIRLHLNVTEHFQNCEKNMRSERTEMAFSERIFRIVDNIFF